MVKSKVLKINQNFSVTVVEPENLIEYVSDDDAEMDKRMQYAVKTAISKSKICKKPVAKYDKKSRRAYIKFADGHKEYV